MCVSVCRGKGLWWAATQLQAATARMAWERVVGVDGMTQRTRSETV